MAEEAKKIVYLLQGSCVYVEEPFGSRESMKILQCAILTWHN